MDTGQNISVFTTRNPADNYSVDYMNLFFSISSIKCITLVALQQSIEIAGTSRIYGMERLTAKGSCHKYQITNMYEGI